MHSFIRVRDFCKVGRLYFPMFITTCMHFLRVSVRLYRSYVTEPGAVWTSELFQTNPVALFTWGQAVVTTATPVDRANVLWRRDECGSSASLCHLHSLKRSPRCLLHEHGPATSLDSSARRDENGAKRQKQIPTLKLINSTPSLDSQVTRVKKKTNSLLIILVTYRGPHGQQVSVL